MTGLYKILGMGTKHSKRNNVTGLQNINRNASPLPYADEEKI